MSEPLIEVVDVTTVNELETLLEREGCHLLAAEEGTIYDGLENIRTWSPDAFPWIMSEDRRESKPLRVLVLPYSLRLVPGDEER